MVAATLARLGLTAHHGDSPRGSSKAASVVPRRPAGVEPRHCATPSSVHMSAISGAHPHDLRQHPGNPRPPAATRKPTQAADLLMSLRHRMAARVQRAWRCFVATQELRHRKAAKAIFFGISQQYGRALRGAFTGISNTSKAVAQDAASTIARNARGWIVRRKTAKTQSQLQAVAHRCRCDSLQLLAATLFAWAGCSQALQRRRLLREAIARRRPPKGLTATTDEHVYLEARQLLAALPHRRQNSGCTGAAQLGFAAERPARVAEHDG